MAISTTPTQTDTKLTRWKRILQKVQNVSGTFPSNNPKPGDTLRNTIVKTLKSLADISNSK